MADRSYSCPERRGWRGAHLSMRVECMTGVTREGSRSITRTLEDLVTTYETEARRQVHEFICRTSLITPITKANEKKLKRARTHTRGRRCCIVSHTWTEPNAAASSNRRFHRRLRLQSEPVSYSEPSAAAHPEARAGARSRPASEPLAPARTLTEPKAA